MATQLNEIGGARISVSPLQALPRHTPLPQARVHPNPIRSAPAATPLPEASASTTPMAGAPPASSLGGHATSVTPLARAAQNPSDEGHGLPDTQNSRAIVGRLTMEVRCYTDLRRARQRLLLQAMALPRYACDGDKVAGAKLYAQVVEDAGHPLSDWLMPYFKAMEPLDVAIAQQAKVISQFARKLPVWSWAEGVAGLSDRFLGIIVGECSAPVGEFRNPSCVWKRMGLAVINGARQRRVTGDAAIEHGYVARRRSIMWNIGESIIKQQVRKGEDDVRFAIGPYGQVYLDRKAYEAGRPDITPALAHNRAKRYMEKRLLRELWKAWRRDRDATLAETASAPAAGSQPGPEGSP